MKKILIVARKEFLDMFRDKRTLIRMILIPLIAFPVIIKLMTSIQESQSEKEATKELEIGYILNGQSSQLVDDMDTTANFTFMSYSDTTEMIKDIKNDSINLGISLSGTFDTDYESGNTAQYIVYYRGADGEEFDRFTQLAKVHEAAYLQRRLAKNDLPTHFSTPLMMVPDNQSEPAEIIGKYAGGILPYFFMAFCFMGCMLPAIDLFAGEKERGTIETLLVTPVDRMKILVGKMIVVASFGLISATVALVGLVGSLYLLGGGGAESEFLTQVSEILTPQLFATLYALLIPVAIFFAGIMIPISVYSRSFKEAQSILTPLNIAVIVPTIVGFLPGIELDYTTSLIPIVNVVLATKAIIAGNPPLIPLIITFVSLLLISAIAVYISFRQFGKEQNILR